MHRRALFFLVAFLLPFATFARGSHGSSHSHSSSHSHNSSRSHHSSYRAGRTAHVHHSHRQRGTRAHGQSNHGRSRHAGKVVHVRSHDRQGTHIRSYDRTTPNQRRADEKRENPTAPGSSPGTPETTPATSQHATGHGYTNSQGERVPSPTWTKNGKPPAGASARCRDGSYSFSRHHQGTCSHHGGVAQWL
jgi:hypothetical protein